MEYIRIAVLSAYDEVCAFLDNSISKSMHYWEDELHTYLKGGAYTYSFKTFTDHDDAQYLVVGNKLSFVYKNKGYYLNIVSVDRDEVFTSVTAYGLSLELTNEETGPYKATGAMSFEQYVTAFNFEKPFEIGINEVSDKRITHEWEGTDTILARLFSLANVFDAELEFVTELDKNYSLEKIVMNVYREHDDNHQGIGSDKTKQGTIKYGNGIKGISKKSDITELYTAIRPTGNDDLTLANLDKSEFDANGNLEYSSPKESIEILAPQARDRFPSTLMADVNGRYICKVWTYDTDNINTLYGQALAQLKKNSTPQVSYTVDGYIDAEIGDTYVIEDSEYKPTLYLEARVTEQQISFINKDNCKTTFDNFEELQSQVNTALLDEMKSMINANKTYDASIISNNGIVFKNGEGSTTLNAVVRENGADITNEFDIVWYKNGAVISVEAQEIIVKSSDFVDKAVYKFEALKDDKVKASCEVTVVNVNDGEDGPQGPKGDSGKNGTNGIDGKDNIIISSTAPENPAIGQLWQTGSGDVIKSWDGEKWNVHYISVENLIANTLSAISANLGKITAGSINIKDLFVVTEKGELTAESGKIGGWDISDDELTAEGGGMSYPRLMRLVSDGTFESRGIDRDMEQIYRSLIYSGSMRVETLDGTDINSAEVKTAIDWNGNTINFCDSASESCGAIITDTSDHSIKIVNAKFFNHYNKRVPMMYSISGTTVVNATGDGITLHSYDDIKNAFISKYGFNPIQSIYDLNVSYINGDGSANSTHIEGCTIVNNNFCVVFRSNPNGLIRINYVYTCSY